MKLSQNMLDALIRISDRNDRSGYLCAFKRIKINRNTTKALVRRDILINRESYWKINLDTVVDLWLDGYPIDNFGDTLRSAIIRDYAMSQDAKARLHFYMQKMAKQVQS